MTTKAIEAGARADLLPCPFCGGEAVRKHGYWIECASCEASIRAPRENITVDGATKKWNTRTLASGELVPASAVAAERERCAKVAEHPRFANVQSISTTKGPEWTEETGNAALCNSHARRIAAAIRSLSPEPASGDYVVVPREPTREMLDAAGAQFLEGIGEYDDGAPNTRPFLRFYRAMLNAATKDGERA